MSRHPDYSHGTNGQVQRPDPAPDERPTVRPPNRKEVWGVALLFTACFKFLMTLILGVEPEPLPTTITLTAAVAGVILLLLGWRERGRRRPR